MGGEEAVLHVEEGGGAGLGGPATDQAEVAGFLGIPAKEHAPPAVGHRHQVIMAGVDVEALAGECSRADVHDDRQTLAADDVEHLLHQHEPLARGEVGDPAARHGEALAHGGGGVLALRLEEHEQVAPEIAIAIHDGRVEAAAHRGRAGDRIGPGGLGNVDLDVDHGFRAVTGGRNARILELLALGLGVSLGDLTGFT